MKDEIWNKSQLESDSSETGLKPIEHKLILSSQLAGNKDKQERPQAKVNTLQQEESLTVTSLQMLI